MRNRRDLSFFVGGDTDDPTREGWGFGSPPKRRGDKEVVAGGFAESERSVQDRTDGYLTERTEFFTVGFPQLRSNIAL